jgi:hypothetical protein
MSFSKQQLLNLNNDPKYGNNWISNINDNININNNYDDKYKLYATGDSNLSGTKYIALPENMVITNDVINKFNLLK